MFEKQKIRPQTVTAHTTTHLITCRRTSTTTVCPRTTSTASRTQPRRTSAQTRQFAHFATARGATSTSTSRTSCPTSSSTSATTAAAAARALTLQRPQRLPQRRPQTLAASRRPLRRTLAGPRRRLWRLLHLRRLSISRAHRHSQPPKTTRSATARALQATRALESQQTALSPRTQTPSHALHPLPLHRPRPPRVIGRAKSRKNRVMSLLVRLAAANQPLIAANCLRIELIHRLAI